MSNRLSTGAELTKAGADLTRGRDYYLSILGADLTDAAVHYL